MNEPRPTSTTRRRPGRVPGPPTHKATVLLPLDLIDWGKQQPEGMSALIRALLDRERERRSA